MSNDDPIGFLQRSIGLGVRIASLTALVLVAGCLRPAQDQRDSDEAAAYDKPMNKKSTPSQVSNGPGSMGRLRELTQQSRDDLAERLKIDPDDINVVEARHVIWPDNSAGCPVPGFNYTQVRSAGVLIQLQADIRTYQYHGGPVGPAFLCEKPSPYKPEPLHPVE